MYSFCLKEIKFGVGFYVKNVKYERLCWIMFLNINRRVENMMCSVEYFDEFCEKFGNGVKYYWVFDISIFLIEIRNKKKMEK